MYARLTRIQVRLERLEHSIKIFQESVLPAIRKQLGFRVIYLFTNPKTGEGLTLSIWDNEQDAIESEKNHYYQEQLVKIMRAKRRHQIRVEGTLVTLRHLEAQDVLKIKRPKNP